MQILRSRGILRRARNPERRSPSRRLPLKCHQIRLQQMLKMEMTTSIRCSPRWSQTLASKGSLRSREKALRRLDLVSGSDSPSPSTTPISFPLGYRPNQRPQIRQMLLLIPESDLDLDSSYRRMNLYPLLNEGLRRPILKR